MLAAKLNFNSARRRDALAIALLMAASAVALFFHLGRAPVSLWDEARVAINALEMMTAANPLIVTYGGEPDLWNPKPPLAIAMAAVAMHLGGINEVALRLPSALAAAGTVFVVFLFTRWVSGSRSVALLAALILLGTGGYVEAHVARSAEPDSFLVFFLAVTTFTLVRSMDDGLDPRQRDRWLYAAAAAFTGAMLSKGIAALLILPGLVLALSVLRHFPLLKSRGALIGAAAVMLIALLHWGGRELAQPGFLRGVWEFEIGGFGKDAPEPWYYYLRGLVWPWQAAPFFGFRSFLITPSAFPWSLLLLVCAPLAARSPRPRVSSAAVALVCVLVAFIAVISFAGTKMYWYVAPAYPLIAVLAALGIGEMARVLSRSRHTMRVDAARLIIPAASALALLCIGVVVWKNEQVARVSASLPEHRTGHFLRQISSELPRDGSVRVLSDTPVDVPAIRNGQISGIERYEGPTDFYIIALRRAGYDVRRVPRETRVGSEVIVGCGARPAWTDRYLIELVRDGCFLMSAAGPARNGAPFSSPDAKISCRYTCSAVWRS